MRTLLALLLLTSPAWANNSLPPARYDLGGETLTEVMENYRLTLGDQPVYIVPFGEAAAKCNEVNLRIWGMPYPVAAQTADGSTMLGCMVHDWGWTHIEIVITDGWPGASPVQLLRHEIGHVMGWSGNHER